MSNKSNYAALDALNVQLWLTGVDILDIKYLNNIVEQSHRWVKQKTRQALGWKSIKEATASLHGREMWTMLKHGQVNVAGDTVCERFYALAE
ncbi:IS6 family transposase [Vibrio parahaemolyticus]|uniref:Transposase n=1 Tax=Vibrio parahaemolyticus TaxID=670 RepID=A0A1Y1BEJ6_VIBPH|nr:DDE domain-containing protein [Vibrio campbellii]OOQ67949.1 IS6 family transposase [Vibrio parahaemolyticus]OUJ21862.1 IS6 family transposase [Vibrio parahaemolyticus]OUJ33713.1 IS6 family transposase [Vibrio parahaemolyticus]OUJ39254.1 IS6 family transposase [Vibrio parahaemolyticus]